MANNSLQPYPYSVPVYAGYMTPMYYPYPPTAVSATGEYASHAPVHASPYIMTHHGSDPYMTSQHQTSSNITYMHHRPAVPMMLNEMPVHQSTQSSAMHPVAPGIPANLLDDSAFENQSFQS